MDKKFYIGRREKIANLLPNNSMMILFAGKDVCESEDQSYEFCINRNFYYLTGINEQNDIFVMVKDEDAKNIIFINRYDELFAKWNGRKMFDHEALELSGITDIRYIDEFKEFLAENKGKYQLYMDIKPNLFSEPLGEAQKLLPELENVLDCHGLIATCRMEKTEEISDHILGYRTLIPIYAIAGMIVFDDIILWIIIEILAVIGYAIYRRGFRFKPGEIVFLIALLLFLVI